MQARRILVVVSVLALLLALSVRSTQAGEPPPPNLTAQDATPLGTGFTYQGHLKQNGSPVNATCDCRFTLWDALIGGVALGGPLDKPAINVTNGLLSIPDLDFGSAFTGEARWLEVAVRCPAGSGTYSTLAPRQALTAAPYALYAAGVPWSGITGVPFAGSGSANALSRSDHNHWGQGWYHSSGTTALSVTNYGSGGALSGSSSGGYGVYGSSTSSAGGYFTSTSGKALEANGDVQITGDLTVTGQISGFPRPNFDSGWVAVDQGATVTITHNLGGDPQDYVVDMTFRDYIFGSGIHQITYGGDVRPDEGSKGVWWEALNAVSIKVIRGVNDARCQDVRIRIWVYK
jgi:hypothetical protein